MSKNCEQKIMEDMPKKVFVIGDLHLDHANIIKYCNRPFKSTSEMNYFIVNNWNNTVKNNDVVYFLGDMAFGRGSHSTDYWVSKLNGKIIFIKGSHDKSKKIKFHDKLILEYKSHKFLLIHDPNNAPKQWKGWIIHGHHHNHYLDEFPFINGKNKTINVSVELINYKPLDIDELFKLNFENIADNSLVYLNK